jgi:hypothetical protein
VPLDSIEHTLTHPVIPAKAGIHTPQSPAAIFIPYGEHFDHRQLP